MAEFDQNMSFEYGPAALFPGNNTLSPPSEGAFGDGNEERGFLRGSIVEKTQPYRTGVKLEAMPNSEDVSSRNRGALQVRILLHGLEMRSRWCKRSDLEKRLGSIPPCAVVFVSVIPR